MVWIPNLPMLALFNKHNYYIKKTLIMKLRWSFSSWTILNRSFHSTKKSNNITYNFSLTQNKKIKNHKLTQLTAKKLLKINKFLILNKIPNKLIKNFKNNHNRKTKKLKANLINNHLKVKRPKTNHRHNKRLKKLNKNLNQSPHNTLLIKIFTILS